MTEQRIAVQTPDGLMPTSLISPDGPPSPGVIVYMPAPGVTPSLLHFARRLSREGYVVAVPHGYYRFGEDLVFDPASDDPSMLGPMRAVAHRLSDAMVLSDTDALLARLAAEPVVATGPKGAVGFGRGARHVLSVMAGFPDQFAAGSGLHPAFIVTDGPQSPHLRLEAIKGELYMGFGAADELTPVQLIPRFEEQVRTHHIFYTADVHPGAGHGFMLPGPAYAPEAAELSWRRTVALLRRTLHRASSAHE
jgi:carboxymethylenebutenolidase